MQLFTSQADAGVIEPENCFVIAFSAPVEVRGNPCQDVCGLVVRSHAVLDHVLQV